MAKKKQKKIHVVVDGQAPEDGEATTPETQAADSEDTSQGAQEEPAPEAADPAAVLEQALAQRDARISELQKEALYLQAELENFKRRTEKRYRDQLEYAAEPLLKDLLPVLDNLERAAIHAGEAGPEGFAPLLEGLGHICAQFAEAMARHGVAVVPAAGERFDPELHEAMAQVPGDEDGVVADVYEQGYKLKARLLRPAKVTVTKVASGSGDG